MVIYDSTCICVFVFNLTWSLTPTIVHWRRLIERKKPMFSHKSTAPKCTKQHIWNIRLLYRWYV